MQQILRKCARDNLRQKGIVEFMLSDLETSDLEPQGKGKARTTKGSTAVLMSPDLIL